MKITKRVSVGFSEDDYFIIKGWSKESRETMSGLIRRLIFAPQRTQHQYTPQKRRLPSIPGAIKVDLNYVERDKFVADNPTLMIDFSIEMKLKMKERKNKIDSYEENLADEVGIK